MTAVCRRAASAAHCLFARDPALLVFGFAVWALLNGVSLALPGSAFDASPVYAVQRAMLLPETLCGAVMIGNAAALLYALHPATSATMRATIGVVTGYAWTLWGCLMIAGAAQARFFSVGGSWLAFVAVAVACSAGSWIKHLPVELR